MKKYLFTVFFVASFSISSFSISGQQQSIGSSGNNNINANTNSGIIIQVNPVVTSGVKAELRAHAKKQFGRAKDWQTLLVPAHDVVRISACPNGIPKGALAVMLGTGVVAYCTKPSCNMNILSSPAENYLSVSRKGTSTVVHAKVFARDGRILAEITDNKVFINKNEVFRWSRPDAHTLTVTDQEDRTALSFRFANRDTISLQGRFFTRSHVLCRIDSKNITCGTNEFSGCFGNFGTAIMIGR